jgi:hypothetical protein
MEGNVGGVDQAFTALRTSSPREAAATYIRAGFKVVPVPHRQKGARIDAWQALRIKEPDVRKYFTLAPQNMGVLTGLDGLTDIDCDAQEALAPARLLLPKTDCVFGRASKRTSHYLYRSR